MDQAAKNRRVLIIVALTVLGMVGVTFAAVPLYRLFCQVTGYNGTTMLADKAPDTIIDRTVTIRFNTDVSPEIAWRFKPEKAQLKTKIGAQNLISYNTKNVGDRTLVGTAIYNVTPAKVGKYFHKIECFCFQEQALTAGEEMQMPVVFFVSPEFASDPHMDDVDTITLSYTFFKANTVALDKALDEFYNIDPEDQPVIDTNKTTTESKQ